MPSSYFFSWIREDSEDVENYKKNSFTYRFKGIGSEHAFWVFDLDGGYKPAKGIQEGRLLVKFDFGEQADTVIRNKENWIDFESSEFMGETKHKNQIIVKSNELGAFGIGANVRGFLKTKSIALATKKELAKALGKSELEIARPQEW